jgi:type VI secretion system protein ImpA
MDDTSLLEPISAGAPCGPDLEYDPAFLALDHSLDAAYADRAVGPESETVSPDWRYIAEQALSLLSRSHDLRVAVVLTKAWLHTQGLAGLARGLSLVRALLCRRWECVHPQLGAQGDTAGLMRIAALRSLCDARSVLAAVRAAPLVGAPGLVALCLRDLEKVHTGGQPTDGSTDAAQVDAVFTGCDLDALRATCTAVNAARAHVSAVEALFAERDGAVLRLSDLAAQLESIHARLHPRLAARDSSPISPTDTQVAAASIDRGYAADSGAFHRADMRALGAMVPVSPVLSRADVVRELDRLCAYYVSHEPSSPVPLLLSRARRLVCMQFVDIVRELAPGGMPEIVSLRGPITTERP